MVVPTEVVDFLINGVYIGLILTPLYCPVLDTVQSNVHDEEHVPLFDRYTQTLR